MRSAVQIRPAAPLKPLNPLGFKGFQFSSSLLKNSIFQHFFQQTSVLVSFSALRQ